MGQNDLRNRFGTFPVLNSLRKSKQEIAIAVPNSCGTYSPFLLPSFLPSLGQTLIAIVGISATPYRWVVAKNRC